jgi:tRNA A-37 threonylcarbamoyl transferase component Bud32
MLSRGTIIDGRFEIVDFLGEGGMGTVYSARHKAMDRQIALKLLKSNLVAEENKVARFRNEARVLSGLDHPNIIAVHAIGIAETGQPYMAMDIVTGDSLSDAIAKRGPFPQDEALRVCIQICKGLQYAHEKKVIHRDIKPSNIILTEDAGHTSVAKLVDFGIAKMLDSESPQLTQTGMALGSVFYLSPGQFEGRVADASSDIYSLGCTLYEMLTGEPPFNAETAFETAMMHKSKQLIPVNTRNNTANIDQSVQTVLDCMLQKDHHIRYQSAQEVEQDLECALQKRPLKFAKTVKAKKAFRPKRRPVLAWAALGVVVTIVLVGLAASKRTVDHSPSADKLTAADLAFETARRDQAAAGSDERAVMVIPEADNAVKLAELTDDPLFITRALDLRARINLFAYKKAGMKETVELWQRVIGTANQAIRKENDRSTADKLALARFNGLSGLVQTYLTVELPVSDKNWHDLLDSFDTVRPMLNTDGLGHMNRMTSDGMELAVSQGTAQEMYRVARVRAKFLDWLGYDRTSRAIELDDMPHLKDRHTPAEIEKCKEIYGIK